MTTLDPLTIKLAEALREIERLSTVYSVGLRTIARGALAEFDAARAKGSTEEDPVEALLAMWQDSGDEADAAYAEELEAALAARKAIQ